MDYQGATIGLSVNTSSRTDVIAFWNAIYKTTPLPQETIGWTGAYGGTCQPGSLSTAFEEDVERRINFYRAMVGLPASVLVNTGSTVVIHANDARVPSSNTTKANAAQQMALSFSYGNTINHNPSSISCLTSAGWNAANKGNLALGLFGVDAIDAYIRENDPVSLSSWGEEAGHRRWLLKQGSTDFATGDVPGIPGVATRRPVNVLYVLQHPDEVESFSRKFVSWPSAGFFPDELVPTQWSLSYPGASFASASVVMKNSQDAVLPIVITNNSNTTRGDNSIVWRVPTSASTTSVIGDTTYSVRVQGIMVGGQSVNHEYSVTIIDPDRLNAPTSISGTSSPAPSGANYHFDLVEGAEEYRFVVAQTEPSLWIEGAENGQSDHILDYTSSGITLRSQASISSNNNFYRSGSKAFRLAFEIPQSDTPQVFEIDREIVAGPGTTISYWLRRGFCLATTQLLVQISEGTQTWNTIDSIAGAGSNYDSSFQQRTIVVPPNSGLFKVRFVLAHPSTASVYRASSSPFVGMFIDDISIQNAEWITNSRTTYLDHDTNQVRFDDVTTGNVLQIGDSFKLRAEVVLGGRSYFNTLLKAVTIGGSIDTFDRWEEVEYPLLTGGFGGDHDNDGLANGVEYSFGTDPTTPGVLASTGGIDGGDLVLETNLPILQPGVSYGVECSTDLSNWDTSGVTINFANGTLTARSPRVEASCFMRWKIDELP